MYWAVLTSNETRHRFLANYLSAARDVAAVVVEPKRRHPREAWEDEDDRALLEAFYRGRSEAEESILTEGRTWNLPANTSRLETEPGEINDPSLVSRVEALDVQACVVYGTSILREPWMDAFEGRMLNIHLGLSPYYRGSGTNLWPLYDGRPELVGATLHQISPEVDAGDIYCQVRPDPQPDDTPHTLGNRTIRRAAEAMVWLMGEFENGRARAVPMPEGPGKEFRFRDFNADVVRRVLERFDDGLMEEYCAREDQRRAETPLVDEWRRVEDPNRRG